MKEFVLKLRKLLGIKYSQIVVIEKGSENYIPIPTYSMEQHWSYLKELKENTIVLFVDYLSGPYKGQRCYYMPNGNCEWTKL